MFEQCYSHAGPWMFFEQTMDDWPMIKTPLWEGKSKCYAEQDEDDDWSNIDWAMAYLSWDKIRGIRRGVHRQYQRYLEDVVAPMSMALHPRLGANSPLGGLDRELMQLVLTRVWRA